MESVPEPKFNKTEDDNPRLFTFNALLQFFWSQTGFSGFLLGNFA